MTDLIIGGFIAPGFQPVQEAFEENFSEDLELGAGFAAYLDGELIVDLEAGYTDRKKATPWTPDTLVPVYSVSKGISALIAAMLVDQGKLNYETRLAHYWPEFGAHGKNKLTVAEALSHQAGVPGFATPINPERRSGPPGRALAIIRQRGVILSASWFTASPGVRSAPFCAKTSASLLALTSTLAYQPKSMSAYGARLKFHPPMATVQLRLSRVCILPLQIAAL